MRTVTDEEPVVGGQVEVAVAVEIADRDRAVPASPGVRSRLERAVAVAEQNVAGTRGEVRDGVVVEVRRKDDPAVRADGVDSRPG